VDGANTGHGIAKADGGQVQAGTSNSGELRDFKSQRNLTLLVSTCW
jgi:hypothetical protein